MPQDLGPAMVQQLGDGKVKLQVGREVGLGGAKAFTIFVGHLVGADTLLACAIEVSVDGIASLSACFHKHGAQPGSGSVRCCRRAMPSPGLPG